MSKEKKMFEEGCFHLQTVRSVSLPVNDVKDSLVDLLPRGVTIAPVVASTPTIL